jgi:hypothetical protein
MTRDLLHAFAVAAAVTVVYGATALVFFAVYLGVLGW